MVRVVVTNSREMWTALLVQCHQIKSYNSEILPYEENQAMQSKTNLSFLN